MHAVCTSPVSLLPLPPATLFALLILCTPSVTFLPWTALDCVLTGYDYGPTQITALVMDLLSGGVITCTILTHS